MSIRVPALVLALSSATAIAAAPSFAAVIFVPTDYPTIQGGVDAASPGDEVRVLPGTYTGPGNKYVDFHGKDIAVIGDGGAAVTIIDCESEGLAFRLDSGETIAARIEGFTIRFGNTYMNEWEWGGGIGCLGASATIRSCVIENCTGNDGGGIFMSTTSPGLIEDCIVRNNGVGQLDAGDPGTGGGLSLHGPITVTNCEIVGNRATEGMYGRGFGGGVVCGGGVRLEDCLIADNSVYYLADAGGIGGSDFTMIRCRVLGNSVQGGVGGGVYARGTCVIEECTIAGNWASLGAGGMLCRDGADVTLRACTIASNFGDDDGPSAAPGGGIRCEESSVHLERAILWGNCSDVGGSEAYLDATSSLTSLCSDVDVGGIEGAGSVIDLGENLDRDPLFCDAPPCGDAPTSEGDYTLHEDSPCLPPASPCGELIGAEVIGCGPTAVREASWGKVKEGFRGR